MAKPRVLIDATTLRTGGGLQAGITFLRSAARNQAFEWFAATSEVLDKQLPADVKNNFREYRSYTTDTHLSKFAAGARLKSWERRVLPNVVYTVFGPAYWRPRRLHVQGFARGLLFAPQVAAEAGRPLSDVFVETVLAVLQKRAIRRTDYLVTETSTVKELVVGHLGFPADRILVIPNSYDPLFDVRTLGVSEERANAASESGRPFRFFTPAWPYPHKNLARQVLAAADLRRSIGPKFKMVFTVEPTSDAWQALTTAAAKVGVSEQIETVGQLNRVRLVEEYRKSDAVVLITLWECSTATYPESFVVGRPVLTSDRPFARELCGDAALYADPLVPQQVAVAMRSLMERTELRQRLVQAGRQQLETQYVQPDRKFECQLDLLERLSNRRPLAG